MDFKASTKTMDIIPQAPTETESTNSVTGGTVDLKTSATIAPTIIPAPSLHVSDEYVFQMKEYFSRPVLISSYDWNHDTELNFEVNPWEWIVTNSLLQRKLSSNYLFRFNLRVNIQVSGSPFYYGHGLAAYEPLATRDDARAAAATSIASFVKNSQQLIKGWFTASGSTSLDMKMPFIYERPYLSVDEVFLSAAQLGVLYFSSTKLRYAGSGTPTGIKIVVNAWLEDVDVSVPTVFASMAGLRYRPEGLISEMADSKIVSNTADTVAAVADKLSDVPVIGSMAKTASFAAKVVGGIARIFGFSKPVNFDSNVRVITFNPFSDMATTVGKDPVSKLTLDPKQEITVDTSMIDRVKEDQLSLAYYSSKESLLDVFELNSAMSIGDNIMALAVTPDLANRSTYIVGPSTYMWSQPTLLQVASLPFLYWRGTICVRVKVVCSAYHKGKVALAYNPRKQLSASFTSKQQSLHMCYLDINPEEEVVAKVNMCQPYGYLPISAADDITETFYFPLSSWSEPQPSDLIDFSNGTLELLVVNPITSSVEPVPPVDLIVTVWGEDMEFQRPNPVGISTGLYYQQEGAGSEMVVGTNNRTAENGSSIYFGEVPVSFRQLLKRYQAYFLKSYPIAEPVAYTQAITFVDLTYPIMFQSQTNGSDTETTLINKDFVLPGGEDITVDQPIFQYLRRMFIGMRGSFRYMLTPLTPNPVLGFAENSYKGSTTADDIFDSGQAMGTPYGGLQDGVIRLIMPNMGGGQKYDLKNSATMQFEIPYQCRDLFLPSQQAQGDIDAGAPLVRAGFIANVTPYVEDDTYKTTLGYAVDMIPGEDFQFCIFTGGAGWSSAEAFPP